jgi:hypothetical protein
VGPALVLSATRSDTVERACPATIELDEVLALVDARLEAVAAGTALTSTEMSDILLDLRSALVETAALERMLARDGKPLLAAEVAR